MSPAAIIAMPKAAELLASQSRGDKQQPQRVLLFEASGGGLLSQAVTPWKDASSGMKLPGMQHGQMQGRKPYYLLAFTTLQLSSISKGNPTATAAAAARPPTNSPHL